VNVPGISKFKKLIKVKKRKGKIINK